MDARTFFDGVDVTPAEDEALKCHRETSQWGAIEETVTTERTSLARIHWR
jgi:hypothetical protein